MPENTGNDAPTGRVAAALALARGAQVGEAARLAGVHEDTVSRWNGDPDFQAEIARQRSEILRQAHGALAAAAVRAVTVLDGALGDEKTGIRIQAASALLSKLVPVGSHIAGLEANERLVREMQGRQLLGILRSVVTALGHDPDDPAVSDAVNGQLRILGEGTG